MAGGRIAIWGVVVVAVVAGAALWLYSRPDTSAEIGSTTVEASIGALESGSMERRRKACTDLIEAGPKGAGAAAAVRRLLAEEKDEEMRLYLGAALCSVSGDPADHVEKLRAALRSPDTERRQLAASLLWKLGDIAASVTPDLIAASKDEDLEVRWRAARALQTVHEPAD